EVRAAAAAIVVVSGHGPGSRSMTAPERVVAETKFLCGAVEVCIVAGREHRARNAVEEPRGRFDGGTPAVSDLARSAQHASGRRSGHQRRFGSRGTGR